MAIVLSLVIYPPIIDVAIQLDLPMRVVVTAASVLPVGFLMGVPFPAGLRIASIADPNGVAAFWGANATTSVFGSALGMALAMSVGFSVALLLGAALYFAAAILIHLTWPRMIALG
jgi:hypothetical protein